MARRKARAKTITRYVKKASKRVKRAASKPQAVIIPAAIYGAARAKVATALEPVLSKIPFGGVADEIGMGLASYLLAKKGKGMVKKIGLAGLTIESARAGEQLVQNGFNVNGGSSTSQTIYG